MKVFKENTHIGSFLGGFLVREPILPPSALQDLNVTDPEEWLKVLYRSLLPGHRQNEIEETGKILEAIAFASPTLIHRIARGMSNLSKKDKHRIILSLYKYYVRAATRATPFGLFAKVAWCQIGHSKTDRDDARRVFKYIRPSSRTIYQWISTLERDPWLKQHLKLYVNPSIVIYGNRIKIVYRDAYGADNMTESCWIRRTPVVQFILENFKSQALFEEIVRALLEAFPEGDKINAERLVYKLLDEGLLLSSLRKLATDPEKAKNIYSFVDSHADRSESAKRIKKALDIMKVYEAKPLGNGHAELSEMLKVVGYDPGDRQNLVYAVLGESPGSVKVQEKDLESLSRKLVSAANALTRLFPRGNQYQHLDIYRDEFRERYGMREVPILELLDEEIGLGPPPTYQQPPATYLRYRGAQNETRENKVEIYNALGRVVYNAIQENKREISIAPEYYRNELPAGSLPITADAVFSLWVFPNQDTERIVLSHIGYVSGAGRVLARFASLDENLLQHIENIIQYEKTHHPKYLFVKIDYLHRIGYYSDLNSQPMQLPTVCLSGHGRNHGMEINISSVRVGLDGDRFYLIAPFNGKDRLILARNNTVFNPVLAPNPIRFMYEVSSYDTPIVPSWRWGPLEHLPFLPRVLCEDVVLALARWRIPNNVISNIEEFMSWKQAQGVPRYVFAGEYDNRLLLDLDNPLSYEVIKNEKPDVLEEAPELAPSKYKKQASGFIGSDHPLSEYVVSLRLSEGPGRKLPGRASRYTSNSTDIGQILHRVIFPGRFPLYFKIYAPEVFHTDIALYFSNVCGKMGESVKWFFVRYFDPEPHLRIRIHAEGQFSDLINYVAQELDAIAAEFPVQKWSVETYEPEVERYGGRMGIKLAEQIFSKDTDIILAILNMKLPFSLIEMSYYSIDRLLAAMHDDVQTRSEIYRAYAHAALRKLEYRKYKSEYWKKRDEYLMSYIEIHKKILTNEYLLQRYRDITEISKQYRELEKNDQLLYPYSYIALSILHMHANRLGMQAADERRVMSYLSAAYSSYVKHIPAIIKEYL